MQVMVAGYNHKLKILLDKIIDSIVSFQVKNERFAVIKVGYCSPAERASHYQMTRVYLERLSGQDIFLIRTPWFIFDQYGEQYNNL